MATCSFLTGVLSAANHSDRYSPGLGDQMRRPDGVGAAAASGLWSQLELVEQPPLNRTDGLGSGDAYYLLPKIRDDLGLKSKREQSR